MEEQHEETPDGVAKKYFLITMTILTLYVLGVVFFVL